MGRPKNDSPDTKFNFAVTKKEVERYRAAAKKAGLTMAGWARVQLRKASSK